MATPKPLINQEQDLKNLKQAILEAKNNPIATPKLLDEITSNKSMAYCFKDSDNQEYYLLPAHILKTFIESAKKLKKDKYLFALEQEIHRNMPIDFEDVWCIALKAVGNDFKKNPKTLIKNIKKQYPYLFIDIPHLNAFESL